MEDINMDDIIPIRLKLPETKIIKVEEDSREDLIIYVETTESGVNCHRCGKHITKLHGSDREIRLRHLSILESDTYIIYKPHRYICEDCDNHPTTTAIPKWHQPGF